MKNKISYIIPTIKPSFCATSVIDNILSFPTHESEIIIISPDPSFQIKNKCKLVLDDKSTGAMYAINKGVKASDGDIVVLMNDDHQLPPDFLRIFDYFESGDFKKKKIKIANICPWFGGPGKRMFFKRKEDQIYNGICSFYERDADKGGVFPDDFSEASPYEIMAFPIFFRDALDKYFSGIIYNERFKQCFADHWLGFYYGLIKSEEDGEMGPKDLWVSPIPNYGNLVVRHQNKEADRQTLLSLIKESFHNTIPYDY